MKQQVNVAMLKPNETNPRFIKDSKFKKLVKSLKEFPEMLEKRPIVVDEDMTILGGNMRYEAAKAAGIFEVWIDVAEGWSEQQKREFIIKDNASYGEWDWDLLGNDWNADQLDEWAIDIPQFGDFEDDSFDLENNNEPYTKKIDSPEYEPKGDNPNIDELYNDEKAKKLIDEINKSSISEKDKRFLVKAAQRHIVFDYAKIAEFYCHADKEVQDLMEQSALIIIDFKKAIQQGYVTLNEKITEQYLQDYGDE